MESTYTIPKTFVGKLPATEPYTSLATDDYTYPKGNPERDEARMSAVFAMNPSQGAMSKACDEVKGMVCGSRQDDYGPPEINHTCTAEFWSVYLGITITALQVCDMMDLQKISRGKNAIKRDNYIDRAGYAVNAIAILETMDGT